MERNIGFIGRLLRILLGMVLLYLAIKHGKKLGKKPAIVIAISGFLVVVQGYRGFCLLRKLGITTMF